MIFFSISTEISSRSGQPVGRNQSPVHCFRRSISTRLLEWIQSQLSRQSKLWSFECGDHGETARRAYSVEVLLFYHVSSVSLLKKKKKKKKLVELFDLVSLIIKTLQLSISTLARWDNEENGRHHCTSIMDESCYLVNLIIQYISLTKRWMNSGISISDPFKVVLNRSRNNYQ